MLEHLPDFEKQHLSNREKAFEESAWMIPFLRAGTEAVKRGEHFYGGTPLYEKQLAALLRFYHGIARKRSLAPVKVPKLPGLKI